MNYNHFVSYDLNGQHPTHQEMDNHLKAIGPCVHRVLETVWYVRSDLTSDQLYAYVNNELSNNDSLIVITAEWAIWRNLPVDDERIKECWSA